MTARARHDRDVDADADADADRDANAGTGRSSTDLSRLRRRIDVVDRRLVALLARRGELARALAAIKRAEGLPLRDPRREAQLTAALRSCNPGPYSDDELAGIMREVLAASRALMARDVSSRPR